MGIVNRANSNLLAVLGFLLIVGGAVTYVALPPGGDRSVILVTVIPVATTLLLGGTIGDRLGTIERNTNGKSDAERLTIARTAAEHAVASVIASPLVPTNPPGPASPGEAHAVIASEESR